MNLPTKFLRALKLVNQLLYSSKCNSYTYVSFKITPFFLFSNSNLISFGYQNSTRKKFKYWHKI